MTTKVYELSTTEKKSCNAGFIDGFALAIAISNAVESARRQSIINMIESMY